MKTPEEWVALHHQANLPSPGSFVHTLLCGQVTAIQRDARQSGIIEGLEIAANLAKPHSWYPECKSSFCEGRDFAKESILAEITKRKKEPEEKR